jgi:hypothetical protein
MKNTQALQTVKSHLLNTGEFFSIKFTKLDGTERLLVGRFGVHKHVKGGVSCLNDNNWNFFDMKDGYRSVRIESIVEVTYDGVTILAEGL